MWQGRFGSVAMDEAHLIAAVRYVSLNPVRAHLSRADDALATVSPVLDRVPDVAALPSTAPSTPPPTTRCAETGDS
jgi:putative transposase